MNSYQETEDDAVLRIGSSIRNIKKGTPRGRMDVQKEAQLDMERWREKLQYCVFMCASITCS